MCISSYKHNPSLNHTNEGWNINVVWEILYAIPAIFSVPKCCCSLPSIRPETRMLNSMFSVEELGNSWKPLCIFGSGKNSSRDAIVGYLAGTSSAEGIVKSWKIFFASFTLPFSVLGAGRNSSTDKISALIECFIGTLGAEETINTWEPLLPNLQYCCFRLLAPTRYWNPMARCSLELLDSYEVFFPTNFRITRLNLFSLFSISLLTTSVVIIFFLCPGNCNLRGFHLQNCSCCLCIRRILSLGVTQINFLPLGLVSLYCLCCKQRNNITSRSKNVISLPEVISELSKIESIFLWCNI